MHQVFIPLGWKANSIATRGRSAWCEHNLLCSATWSLERYQIRRDEEEHFFSYNGTTDQEDITVPKTYVPKLATPSIK